MAGASFTLVKLDAGRSWIESPPAVDAVLEALSDQRERAVGLEALIEGVLTKPYRVGVAVNSNRASGAGLIVPVAA